MGTTLVGSLSNSALLSAAAIAGADATVAIGRRAGKEWTAARTVGRVPLRGRRIKNDDAANGDRQRSCNSWLVAGRNLDSSRTNMETKHGRELVLKSLISSSKVMTSIETNEGVLSRLKSPGVTLLPTQKLSVAPSPLEQAGGNLPHLKAVHCFELMAKLRRGAIWRWEW